MRFVINVSSFCMGGIAAFFYVRNDLANVFFLLDEMLNLSIAILVNDSFDSLF